MQNHLRFRRRFYYNALLGKCQVSNCYFRIFWYCRSEYFGVFQVQDHSICSYDGYRDLQAANISNEICGRILNENPGAKLGSSFVYGEIGVNCLKPTRMTFTIIFGCFRSAQPLRYCLYLRCSEQYSRIGRAIFGSYSNIGMSRKKRAALCYMNFTHTGK